jgi:HD-GYP domain-containing protein (c-di-GMP phosphodiesterase class II)
MPVSTNKDNSPLYNSRIVDNYIKLIRKNYSFININDLLRHAEMEPYGVADQGHWFTQKQINLFHQKLSELTKNENIAQEAGRYAAMPEASGVMRQWILGLVGPATAYEMIGKYSTNFTRSTRFKTKKIAPNKVEITVTPRDGVRERPFQCQNRTGYLEAVAMLFGSKLSSLNHPECVFRGGKTCRYIIGWEKSFSDLLKRIKNYTMLFLFAVCLVLSFGYPLITLTALLPGSVAIVLLLSLVIGNIEKSELKSSLNNLKYSTDQLVEQININYNNALMTNEIGHAISSYTNIEDILSSIVRISKKRLDYDRCMILLSDPEKKRLRYRTGYGFTKDQLSFLTKTAFHLNRPQSKGVFVVSFKEQKPFLINNVKEIETDLSIKSLTLANKLGSQSFICCPIRCDKKSLGVLAVDNLRSKRPLVQSDISLLMGVASVLGVSIRNAQLHEARERQFRSILQVLAASIDARDPLTSGHSEKVTKYALGIAHELGLPRDDCQMIQVAALLHDYGKIAIPDAILKKPGKLTEHEYEIVKNHSFKSRRILEQISFDGVFNQVPEIVGAHHEKFNGNGYPDGLQGEEIPLGARIIAVADFFEATTAKRHYRGPIPLHEAIMLLKNESGKSFDRKIVDAFFNYYSKTHAGEPAYRASMI